MKYGFFVTIVIALLISSCGGKKKKSMSGTDEVTAEDFIEFYPEVNLPFTYSDTSFRQSNPDSLLISQHIFNNFIPDSTVNSFFGQNSEPEFYSLGRFNNKDAETYLITKGITKDKKLLLLSAYDKEKKFIANLPLIRSDKSTSLSSVFITIDPKFNITKNISKKLPGDVVVQGNDVYILNAASKKFMLVMTDSLGEASGELINPIDTLPRSSKYAGDYGDGKQNLISFRDGQREGRMHLFVHLNNEKEGCSGEIKGEVTLINPTTAEYRQGGDPCVLRFVFNKTGVSIQEVEGCGSRLGALQCTFNGSYAKHKVVKPGSETGKKAIPAPKTGKK